MTVVTPALRAAVVHRAINRCVYCGLSQAGQEATFHVDHVVPLAAGGPTRPSNLALTCVACSLFKGARQTAPDPRTGRPTPLFNPRRQRWTVRFLWQAETAVGRSPVGRATIAALRMDRPLILSIRREEAARGRHPHR